MITLRSEVLAGGFFFLEGPRWHDGTLWMSDMIGRKVYRLGLDGRTEIVAEVPNRPSGLGFMPDGSLLIVSMQDRTLLRLRNGSLAIHSDLRACITGEPNDMVVDRNGRAYVGVFSFRREAAPGYADASLVLVEPDGQARAIAHDLAFPNGSVITTDGRLVVAETFGHRLTAFEILADGTLGRPVLFADLGNVAPDGISSDSEGGVWLAGSGSPYFMRILEGGRVTHQIRIPHCQAVACALGGPDGRSLFCTTVDKRIEAVDGCPATAQVHVAHVETPALRLFDSS
jgi:sugar lactone lactonase YvrE